MFRTLVRRAADSTVQVGRSAASHSGGAGSEAVASVRTRYSTNIAGITVHPAPLTALLKTYDSTLSILKTLPEDSVYRQATTAVTQHRLSVLQSIASTESKDGRPVDNEEAIQQFEEQIDEGLVEEVLNQAQHEQGLAAKMLDWKP